MRVAVTTKYVIGQFKSQVCDLNFLAFGGGRLKNTFVALRISKDLFLKLRENGAEFPKPAVQTAIPPIGLRKDIDIAVSVCWSIMVDTKSLKDKNLDL